MMMMMIMITIIIIINSHLLMCYFNSAVFSSKTDRHKTNTTKIT